PHPPADSRCSETYKHSGHVKTCTACTATKTEEHTYSTTYTSSGKSGHYRTCTAAGCDHTETEAHAYAYTDNGDGTQQNNCTRCDYSVRAPHAYDGDACKDCGYPKPVLEGGTIDDRGILTAYTGSAAAVEIPYGVLEIGNRAFYNCTSLTSVTIPDSVAYIGQSVFSDCTGLTSVTIPSSEILGQYLFYGCTSLTNVTISASVKYIHTGAFGNCTSLTSVNYGGTMAEWGQIELDSYTGLSGKTIICTDGTLTL
ncbi:MAG: leucine-rich repeat domain-containing protein, partial [Treponemataceae bacterium]|nr:leucine-rich repeat domain-containing protein [Treponemataceae bacterium]